MPLLRWVSPGLLAHGITPLADRYWARHGRAPLTVRATAEGRSPPHDHQRRVVSVAPLEILWGQRKQKEFEACWLFAMWKLQLEAVLRVLDAAIRFDPQDPYLSPRPAGEDRRVFLEELLAEDDRLGQPEGAPGGLLGVAWYRRLRAWTADRQANRAKYRAQPASYPRAILDDVRAVNCGGQYALSHLVDSLIDARYPYGIDFGHTSDSAEAARVRLRNERRRLGYHLRNACAEVDPPFWRVTLAQTAPRASRPRRAYHFFTAGERHRVLAYATPRLPAPLPIGMPRDQKLTRWIDDSGGEDDD